MMKTIGMVAVAALAASGGRLPPLDDHRHLTADQIGRQRRKPLDLALRPSEFDRHVAAFDIAGFAQPFAEHATALPVRRAT